jgi:hypothetical protein
MDIDVMIAKKKENNLIAEDKDQYLLFFLKYARFSNLHWFIEQYVAEATLKKRILLVYLVNQTIKEYPKRISRVENLG